MGAERAVVVERDRRDGGAAVVVVVGHGVDERPVREYARHRGERIVRVRNLESLAKPDSPGALRDDDDGRWTWSRAVDRARRGLAGFAGRERRRAACSFARRAIAVKSAPRRR